VVGSPSNRAKQVVIRTLRIAADEVRSYKDPEHFINLTPDEMDAIADRLEALEAGLRQYGYAEHYGEPEGLNNCDRNPYSNPISEAEVPEDSQGRECTCGAAEQNAAVDALLGKG
jgi:hypothetical protein